MIIELCGLPGVGKSHVAALVYDALKIPKQSPPTRTQILCGGIWGMVTEFPSSLLMIKAALATSWRPYYVWNILFYRYATYMLAKRHSSWIILDEGLAQNLISYAPALQSVGTRRRLHRSLPPVSLRILIDVEDAIRQKNIIERERLFPEKKVTRTLVKERAMEAVVREWGTELLSDEVRVTSVDEALSCIQSYVNNQK
jgi:hypothetical protein